LYNFETFGYDGFMKREVFAIAGILMIGCSGSLTEEIIDCSLSELSIEVTEVKFEDCGI